MNLTDYGRSLIPPIVAVPVPFDGMQLTPGDGTIFVQLTHQGIPVWELNLPFTDRIKLGGFQGAIPVAVLTNQQWDDSPSGVH